MKPRQLAHACRDCHRPIIWAISPRGSRLAIDRDPVVGGTVRLQPGTPPVALVLDPKSLGTVDLFDETDDGIRFTKHSSTCPAAKAEAS